MKAGEHHHRRLNARQRSQVSLTPDFSPVRATRCENEPFQRLHSRGGLQKAVETAHRIGLPNTWLKPGVTEWESWDRRDAYGHDSLEGCFPALTGK